MAMQLRRGTNAQRLAMTPLIGELIFVTDYVSANVPALWIGDGSTVGGVVAASQSLDNLTDVTITTPNEGQTLYYDATDSQWRNTSILEVNDTANKVEVNGNIDVAGNINATGDLILNSDGGANTVYVQFAAGRQLQWDHPNQRFEFESGDLYINGDLIVAGNDIKSSSATAISLSGSDVTVAGDLQVNGNDIKSSTGASALTLSGSNVTVNGNLTVNGTTTTIESATLVVDDSNITIGKDNTTDAQANGGGITLKGASDKTIAWSAGNNQWELSNGIYTPGNVTAGSDIVANGNLTLNNDGGTNNVVITFKDGPTPTNRTLQWAEANTQFEFNAQLYVGANINTTGDLFINVDGGANDSYVYFNTTENLKWDHANSKFVLSDDLDVTGDISATGITAGNIRVGITTDNTIDTTTGNLRLNSTGGTLEIDDAVTVSGNVNVDSGVLFVDAANNQVGINTTAPAAGYGLDVNDNARVNGNFFVSGSTTIGNAPAVDVLSVDSVSYFNGNVYIYQNAQIGDSSADTLTVNSTSQFNNNVTLGSSSADLLTVNSTPTFSADVTFNNNVIVGSDSSDTLTVNSTSQFNNNVTLGSSNADTVTVNGQLSTDITFANATGQARGVRGTVGTDDNWFVGGYAATTNNGQLIIATADDGTEPIYVRQYTGTILSGTVTNQLTLLDSAGDTTLPNNLTVGSGVNASQLVLDSLATYNTQTTTTTATTATNISNTGRTAQKVVIKINDTVTGEIHVLEALVARKGTTAYLTTYAEMYSNTPLATFTATVVGTDLRILATPASANSTIFNVTRVSLD